MCQPFLTISLVLNHLNNTVNGYDMNAELVCGYEAGCLGYSLQRFCLKKELIVSLLPQPQYLFLKVSKRSIRTVIERLRFAKAEQFMSYLGIVPGENSSGEKQQRLNITKAGNSHIRRLLIESAHSYNRISKMPKSKELKRRQAGAPAEVIEYADKARDRLRRRYFHLLLNNKKTANTANTAIARELAGFIWGMMVGKIK